LAAYGRVVVVLAGLSLAAASAWAHAILMRSEPAAGARVPAGRLAMSFRYNSRIDRERSRLTLTRPDQSQTLLKIDPAGSPDMLQTTAELATPGSYVVRWQVLAIDGHITRGDVPFIVMDR
jgi:hypothetical protein